MSSVSNSDRPYKSRILNFVNRQWLRVGDRAKRGLRQLQTASVWGIQILAYPLYLLVQTSTVVSKQLQHKAVKLLSPQDETRTASVGSQPTAVVLNSLHPWLAGTPYQLLPLPQTRPSLGEKLQFWRQQSPPSPQPNSSFPTTPQPQQRLLNKLSFLSKNQSKSTQHYLIQGIATYLETGKLVLVTTENQAVDLLSDSQHEQLKQRMKVLLECYEQMQQPWWWRVASQPQRGGLHPLRWLSQLMIWIQTSPFAKRLNWFQESQLRLTSDHEAISQKPPFPAQTGWLDRLDRALSRWENTQLSPVIDSIRQWKTHLDATGDQEGILALIRSAVDYFYGVNPQNSLTGDRRGEKLVNQPPKLLKSVAHFIQQGKARIHHSPIGNYFNRLREEEQDPFTLEQLIQSAIHYFYGAPESSPLASASETEVADDPWLTRADLFGELDSPQALPAADPPSEAGEAFAVAVTRYLSDEGATAETEPQSDEQQEALDHASDWLHTEAVSMGYEKHILARILEWLDRALVWLEEKLLKVWKQFLSRDRQ